MRGLQLGRRDSRGTRFRFRSGARRRRLRATVVRFRPSGGRTCRVVVLALRWERRPPARYASLQTQALSLYLSCSIILNGVRHGMARSAVRVCVTPSPAMVAGYTADHSADWHSHADELPPRSTWETSLLLFVPLTLPRRDGRDRPQTCRPTWSGLSARTPDVRCSSRIGGRSRPLVRSTR